MRIVHTFSLPAVAALIACSPSPDRVGAPAAPMEGPMTPAAGLGAPVPATPPPIAREPIAVEHGQTRRQIKSAILLVDDTGDAGRLMFFDIDASCEDAMRSRNVPSSSLLLAADVPMWADQMNLTQSIEWTYYANGNSSTIPAGEQGVVVSAERIGDERIVRLRVATQVDTENLTASGPIAITTCQTPASVPSDVGSGMKKK
jgi:hypothetical protein